MSTTQNDIVGISQTISRSLQDAGYGSYAAYARPVIEALTARENELAEKLVDYAVDAGADAGEIRAYLREIGMAVATEPEEDLESADDEDEDDIERIEKSLADIARQIGALTAFARDNGFRG